MSIDVRFALPDREPENPKCPVCGDEMSWDDVFYLDSGNHVCGCSKCLAPVDPWEVEADK